MYYNIKIKTKDAEFSLESNNSNIVQREMDIYFACFFDASYEFKSRIKKVEIKNEDLVSIGEIAKNTPVVSEEIQEEIIEEDKQEDFGFVEDIPTIHEQTLPDLKFDLPKEIESRITDSQFETMAQIESQVEPQENVEAEIQLETEVEPVDTKQEEQIETNSLFSLDSVQSETFNDFKTFSLDLAPKEENVQQKEENNLDFKLFLAGFIISDLSNEFLACAYYIKNILKEESFSMKTINSYLFQAVGKIADMSTVTDLVDKDFISFVDFDSTHKYSITTNGEEYFKNKYQV